MSTARAQVCAARTCPLVTLLPSFMRATRGWVKEAINPGCQCKLANLSKSASQVGFNNAKHSVPITLDHVNGSTSFARAEPVMHHGCKAMLCRMHCSTCTATGPFRPRHEEAWKGPTSSTIAPLQNTTGGDTIGTDELRAAHGTHSCQSRNFCRLARHSSADCIIAGLTCDTAIAHTLRIPHLLLSSEPFHSPQLQSLKPCACIPA